MTIVYDRLMQYRIPEVRETRIRTQSALYALSIGLGQDPLDRRQLRFVDRDQAMQAVPSMVGVMTYAGFWLRNPDTGVDAVRLTHGEQSFSMKRPLPVEGEFLGRTYVTRLIDKGVGKGALLYYEKQIIDTSRDELIAVTNSTIFLRGDGGFGGPSGPVDPPPVVPQTPPDIVVDLPTRPEQALYYRLNGDFNPVHSDPQVAAKAGFERPVLHGLCTMGVACHALLRELAGYESDRLRSMRLRFSAPVFPGESLRTEIWNDGSFRVSATERGVVVATGISEIVK